VSYWLPDPLPLPKRTKALRFSAGPIDLAAAWYWTKRLTRAKKTDTDLDTLSEEDWSLLRYTTTTGFARPTWMRRPSVTASGGSRPYGYTNWHGFLHAIPLHPRFELLCVPFITANGYGSRYGEDSELGTRYLVVRGEGERRRVYPRALIGPRHGSQPQRTLRPEAMERLAPLWDRAFDALPALARNQLDAISGMPALGAGVPQMPYADRLEATHPFWRNATALAHTAFGLCRLTLPRPNVTYAQSYMWTVHSPRFDESAPDYKAGPLTVEMPADGWFGSSNKDPLPPVDGDVLARLGRARRAIEVVLNRFAPFDTPLFFDTLQMNNLGGYRFDDEAWGKTMSLVGTGQHFPWLRLDSGENPATLHSGFRWAKTLPPDWLAAFQEALGPHPFS
jgi:hypothetical protein